MTNLIFKALLFLSVASLTESFLGIGFGPIQLTINKLATGGLMVWVVAGSLASRSGSPIPTNAKNVWIVFFGAALIPASATALILGRPIPALINGLVQPISLILFYFVLVYSLRRESDLRLVSWALVLGLGAAAVTALIGVGRVAEGSYYGRSGGLGGNPNLLAVNCVMGLGMMVPLLLQSRGKNWSRVVLLGLAALLFLAIVATVSRTGFLTLIALGGFVLVRSRRLDLAGWAIPIILVMLIGFLFVAPERYYERIGTIGSEASEFATFSRDNARVEGWYWALKAFVAYPFTGVGLGTFHTWVLQESHGTTTTPHSSYLQILSSMGLVGFVPFMALLVLSWTDLNTPRRYCRRMRERASKELISLETWALYYQGCLLVWLVAGVVSPFALDKGPWLLIAISTVVRHMAQQRARSPAGSDAAEPPAHAAGEAPISSFAPG